MNGSRELPGPDEAHRLYHKLKPLLSYQPKSASASDLYDMIRRGVNGLAALAEAEIASSKGYAANLLPSVIKMTTNRAVKVLESAAAEPSKLKLSAALSAALIDSNLIFHYAVKKHPQQFTPCARKKLFWPSLRYGQTVRINDEFEQLVQNLGVGQDLREEWGIKFKGAVDFESVAVRETLLRVIVVSTRRQELTLMDFPLPKEKKASSLPPLSRDPGSQRQWWKLIKPMLEEDRNMLQNQGALKDYLRQAQKTKAKSCRQGAGEQDRYRAKAETLAWNRFITDCKAALLRIAPVTDIPRKKP